MTVSGLCEGASRRTAERVAGREVLAIQDTSEIILGGRKALSRGYGPVGKGGQLGGVLLHPVLAVDALTGELFGLADIAVWNREKRRTVPHSRRLSSDKESNRWLTGMKRAADVLQKAAQVTVVSDRESDIHEDFTQRPATVHLLLRAGFNRRLDNGKKLFEHADELSEACRFSVTIAAAPGRTGRFTSSSRTPSMRCGITTLLRAVMAHNPGIDRVECVLLDLCVIQYFHSHRDTVHYARLARRAAVNWDIDSTGFLAPRARDLRGSQDPRTSHLRETSKG